MKYDFIIHKFYDSQIRENDTALTAKAKANLNLLVEYVFEEIWHFISIRVIVDPGGGTFPSQIAQFC